MDNTTTMDSPNHGVNGPAYGIVFTIGMILLITIFLIACVKLQFPFHILLSLGTQPPTTASVQPFGEPTTHAQHSQQRGIDDDTLQSYPKVLYSHVRDSSVVVVSCSICLDDYKDTDVLRKLPDCDHLYHVDCIDSWLKSHPTCPLCRTSPSPVRPDSQAGGPGEGQQEEVAIGVE